DGPLHPVKDRQEGLVEGVVLGLPLHQQGAGEVVEGGEVGAIETPHHRLQERQPLGGRDANPCGPQLKEERHKHSGYIRTPRVPRALTLMSSSTSLSFFNSSPT